MGQRTISHRIRPRDAKQKERMDNVTIDCYTFFTSEGIMWHVVFRTCSVSVYKNNAEWNGGKNETDDRDKDEDDDDESDLAFHGLLKWD